MKYHYQQGITEKDKKGHKKLWFGILSTVGLAVYGGFIFANLALNGWPLEPVDKTARIVKTTEPGSEGDHLFIPAINLAADFSNTLMRSGDPKNDNVTVKGKQLAFSVTPEGLRASSPFFNLDKLKKGDQIFLDDAKTRYVYELTDSPGDSKKIILQSKDKKLTAEAIGTIAVRDGKAELKPL